MQNVYFVFQKPESAYHDLPFERYDYPVSIPNGRKLKIGDLVIFDLTSKGAQKVNGNKEKRITGFGVIGDIFDYQSDNDEHRRIATYSWHYKFPKAMSFNDFGGDLIKLNAQHSISSVRSELVVGFLIKLLNSVKK